MDDWNVVAGFKPLRKRLENSILLIGEIEKIWQRLTNRSSQIGSGDLIDGIEYLEKDFIPFEENLSDLRYDVELWYSLALRGKNESIKKSDILKLMEKVKFPVGEKD